METFPTFFTLLLFRFLFAPHQTLAAEPPCLNKCGSLELNYPLGSGYGCGSPQFHPYITCPPNQDHLLLTTHTGSYPVTSISYTTSTLTITPPLMSTCTSMHSSPNFGLDWTSPFQLGPSIFLLLSCPPPTSSLTIKGTPICDPTNTHFCASIHTCPSVGSLGLPLFAPINTCCAYSPANLNPKGDLDLEKLKCAGYVSVVSLGDVPTDPNTWEYGISLKYGLVGLDNNNIATRCQACEKTDGICGYAPPRNDFVCVCKSGLNSSSDCYNQVPAPYWSSDSDSFRIVGSTSYHVIVLFVTCVVWGLFTFAE